MYLLEACLCKIYSPKPDCWTNLRNIEIAIFIQSNNSASYYCFLKEEQDASLRDWKFLSLTKRLKPLVQFEFSTEKCQNFNRWLIVWYISLFTLVAFHRQIPIIASTAVELDFGTGCLKITPGHDPTDYAIGQENGLEIINIMGDDGSLNANAGKYEGLERFQARKAIWKDLQVIPKLKKTCKPGLGQSLLHHFIRHTPVLGMNCVMDLLRLWCALARSLQNIPHWILLI